MSEYQYYYDFTLTNPKTGKTKSLSDFGGIIYNNDNSKLTKNLLPEPNHIVEKNENIDGERYVKTTYGTRVIEIPCFFNGENACDLDELNMWLGTKHQQTLSFEGDYKEIDVVYNNGFNIDLFYGKEFNGVITLNFIAHDPYWRLKKEHPVIYRKSDLTINKTHIIPYRGNANSYPLIQITPTGTQSKIRFKWNHLEVELSNIDKDFYMDCKKLKCYEYINGKMTLSNKFKKDIFNHFPLIDYELKNTFTLLEGSVDKISIDLNTRII